VSEHLAPLDATFLELEDADASAHMHIGAVMVFDPVPGAGAPALDAVRRHLLARLGAMPRFRERLSQPTAGGLSYPSWEPDPSFDIDAHVRRAALPAPGGRQELVEWAADFWSHRLERSRPLWEMVLLEGLADERWALVSKTHHAMVDGVGSVDVAHLLLDAAPDAAVEGAPAPAPEPAGAEAGSGTVLLRLPGAVVRGARAGLGAVLHPSALREALARSRALAELIVRDELVPARPSSLNRPIGARRRFDVVHARLDDLKLVKRELGGTVNDVVLAAAAGGLRALLLHRGEEPPQRGLRAMVPVNVRGGAEHLALGNRITSLFVHLPVAEAAPLARYARTIAEAEELKAGDQALGSETLLELAGIAPPVLHAMLARALFATRLFNVTVTNVPGPQTTLYAFGAPVREVFGLVPLAAEHAIGIAVLSYDGRVTFGLNADYDTVPDLDVLARGIERSLAELLEIARGTRAAHRRAPAKQRLPSR